MRGIFLLPFLVLVGCASHSTRTAQSLQNNDDYRTLRCQIPVMEAESNDDYKIVRMIASPIAVLASGGTLLIPVLVGNASMETKDQLDARKIAQNCGGEPKSDGRIAAEVVGSTAVSMVAQGAQIGPAGIAVQNTQR